MMEKIERANLQMAGEYAAASEVCRRNLYAQVTLGNLKRTDIIVYDPNRNQSLFLEVKAKQGREWPGIKGIADDKHLLVFVDFRDKRLDERPDFYLLNSKDWQDYLDSNVKNQQALDKLQDNYIPIWKDGYKGTGVKLAEISKHLEKWEKLKSILSV